MFVDNTLDSASENHLEYKMLSLCVLWYMPCMGLL